MWADRVLSGARSVLGAIGVLDRDLPTSYADGATPPAHRPPPRPDAAATLAASLAEAEAEALGGPRALTVDNVEAVLDEMVRPALQADGGDITLVRIEDDVVYVRLVGACSSCPSSTMTMRMGVERLLLDEFPQMAELVQVDDLFG